MVDWLIEKLRDELKAQDINNSLKSDIETLVSVLSCPVFSSLVTIQVYAWSWFMFFLLLFFSLPLTPRPFALFLRCHPITPLFPPKKVSRCHSSLLVCLLSTFYSFPNELLPLSLCVCLFVAVICPRARHRVAWMDGWREIETSTGRVE